MPLPPLVEPVTALSDAERERTSRHAALAGFGELGQRRLAAAHIAVVGAGGLGSPAILALAAAGVGTLTVIDDDVVETSNLQRQVIHRLADVGGAKVDSALRAAADLSPGTVVHAVRAHLDDAGAEDLLRGADLVLDGSDSFATRASVASACERLGVPLVWGVVQEFHAQVTVFWSRPPQGTDAVVLADLYPPESTGELPSCSTIGVLGALTMQVGALMAGEAIKLVAGIGDPLLGRVLVIDSLRGRFTEVPLRPSTAASANTTAEIAADTPPSTPDARRVAENVRRSVPVAVADTAGTAAAANTTAEIAADTPSSTPDARRVAENVRRSVPVPVAVPVPAPAAEPPAAAIRELTAHEMLAAHEAGATLLDVREPWETASGVVAGSVVVPLRDFLADPGQIGDEPVVVICAHGLRARRAAEALQARGVDASILAGGIAAWTNG